MMQVDVVFMHKQQDMLNWVSSMLECISCEVKETHTQLNMELEETEKIKASLMGQVKSLEELEVVAKQLQDVIRGSAELYEKTERELASRTHESTPWKELIVKILPGVPSPFPIPKPVPHPFWDINLIIIPEDDKEVDGKLPESADVSNLSNTDTEQDSDDPLIQAIGMDSYPYREYEIDVTDDEFRYDQIGGDVKPYTGTDFTPIVGVLGILGVIIDGRERSPQENKEIVGDVRPAGSVEDREQEKREQSDLDMREISRDDAGETSDFVVKEEKEQPDRMPEEESITKYVPIELTTEEGVERMIGDGEAGSTAETDSDWLSQILNNTILGDIVAFIRSLIGEDGFDFQGLLSKIMEFFSGGKGLIATGGLMAAAGMAAGSSEDRDSNAGGDNWLQNLWNQFTGGGMSESGLVADSIGGGAISFGDWMDNAADNEKVQHAEAEWHNVLENLESETDHMPKYDSISPEDRVDLNTDANGNLSTSLDIDLEEENIPFDSNGGSNDLSFSDESDAFSGDGGFFDGDGSSGSEGFSGGDGSSSGGGSFTGGGSSGGGSSFDGGGLESPDFDMGTDSALDFSADGVEGQMAGDVVGYMDSTPSTYDFGFTNSGAHDFDSQWGSVYGNQNMESVDGTSKNTLDLSLEQQLLMGITSFASISMAGASDLLDENLKKAKKKFRDRMNGRYF